jgi:outer membrane protein TolC
LCGCTVGPNYHRPSVEVPSSFKEAPPAGWKAATPNDAIAKGNWWEVFGDPKLNELESQAMVNNPPLQAAMARVAQARAQFRITRADLYPTVTLDPSALRTRYSGTRENPPGFVTTPYTDNTSQSSRGFELRNRSLGPRPAGHRIRARAISGHRS